MPTSPWKHFEIVKPADTQPITVRIIGPWRPPTPATWSTTDQTVRLTDNATIIPWWYCDSWKPRTT